MNVVVYTKIGDGGDLASTGPVAQGSADVQQIVASAETAWAAHRARV